ncbi:MAG: hypothetical protein CMC95_02850 [Flavobacteriales bacterium]|jgi:hypothetical protein|nr:hypothetical protein [Flavobacteriales bacterium]|tara:strand:+ start:22088 stop:22825 length:738 start_codon:yes stop_codon:yes gene_type:complete
MKFSSLFLLLLITVQLNAQSEGSKEKIVFISPFYELQFPFGDMKNDYGINSSLGLDVSLINSNNIYLSLSGSFLFGSQVKDTTILDHLMDDNYNIIDENGQIAEIILSERGFNTSLKLGYLYPILHQSSGLLAYASVGFHQHKTRIDVKNSTVPQLDEESKKMYDQLTNGLSTSAFIGYLNISDKSGLHFYAGMELTRSFSYNQRSYNHIVGGPINDLRNDSFLGLKFGWIVPIKKRSTKEYYYF